MPLSAIQPKHYESLLNQKVEQLLPEFAPYAAGRPTIYPSPPTGFRMRAEFRLWHEGDDLHYVMFRRGAPGQPVVVDRFPIASDTIQKLMPALLEAIRPDTALRRKLFQVEFLTTLNGEALVTLIYHRPLDDDWRAAAERLASDLSIAIVGRSRKQKQVIGRDWVDETLVVAGETFSYRQPEQAFTQPNAQVNQAMIEWAQSQAHDLSGDLLELYCGIGNFTLPLAGQFERVIATELSKVATAAAEHNRQQNGIDNVEFTRLSAEEMTQAMDAVRPFRRLQHLHKPLTDYRLNTLLVDPPRAGLDPTTLGLATRFESIIYISCNPTTLLDNLSTLAASHRVTSLAFFDQFPYTQHMECGVRLERR